MNNYKLAKCCDTCTYSFYDATDDLRCPKQKKPIDGHYVCDKYKGIGELHRQYTKGAGE